MIEPALIYDIAWIVGVMLIAVVVYHLLALIIMGVLVFTSPKPQSDFGVGSILFVILIFVMPAIDGIGSAWVRFQKHFPNAAKRLSMFVDERTDDSVIDK